MKRVWVFIVWIYREWKYRLLPLEQKKTTIRHQIEEAKNPVIFLDPGIYKESLNLEEEKPRPR